MVRRRSRIAVGAPIAGSVLLFLRDVALYLFFATAIGLLLGTVARSMPQLGLLFILVVLPMNLLSGGSSPFESMPVALQMVMSAFHPFRRLRPGDPLPRRRTGHRLAAIPRHRADRRGRHGNGLVSVP